MEKSIKERTAPSQALIGVVAVSVGALVANIYYAQPLIASIGPSIGIGTALSGSLVSVTQIGYGAGLFFLVSLADLVENRRLVLIAVAVVIAGLVAIGLSQTAVAFALLRCAPAFAPRPRRFWFRLSRIWRRPNGAAAWSAR